MKYFFVLILPFMGCRKHGNDNLNPAAQETGYLLANIITDGDTTMRAEYNSRNQLVKYIWQISMCDSMVYDGNGKLVGFRCALNNATQTGLRITCVYADDSIMRVSGKSATPTYSDVKRYSLSGDKIVGSADGSIFNGIQSPYYYNISTYSYDGNNLGRSDSDRGTISYHPVDSFFHHDRLYNPYRSMGKHMWTLLNDGVLTAGSQPILLSESNNLPIIEHYAWYSISNVDVINSGVTTYESTVLEVASENPVLPKIVKRVRDDGVESVIEYVYVKMN